MLVIGLTGGIGSGKTAASDYLATKGINVVDADVVARLVVEPGQPALQARSEEHTSELQSRPHLVCRLLLEKKKNIIPHCTFVAIDSPSQSYLRLSLFFCWIWITYDGLSSLLLALATLHLLGSALALCTKMR